MPDAAGGEGREAALALYALTKGDCDMKRTYEMPTACLLTFENDIICTSGLDYVSGGGTGDLLLWDEI